MRFFRVLLKRSTIFIWSIKITRLIFSEENTFLKILYDSVDKNWPSKICVKVDILCSCRVKLRSLRGTVHRSRLMSGYSNRINSV